jgi:hypothetical protein
VTCHALTTQLLPNTNDEKEENYNKPKYDVIRLLFALMNQDATSGCTKEWSMHNNSSFVLKANERKFIAKKRPSLPQ